MQGLRLGWRGRAGQTTRQLSRRIDHGERIRSRQHECSLTQPRLLPDMGAWGMGPRASRTLAAVVPTRKITIGTLAYSVRGSLIRPAGACCALRLFVSGCLEGMMEHMPTCRRNMEQCQGVHGD